MPRFDAARGESRGSEGGDELGVCKGASTGSIGRRCNRGAGIAPGVARAHSVVCPVTRSILATGPRVRELAIHKGFRMHCEGGCGHSECILPNVRLVPQENRILCEQKFCGGPDPHPTMRPGNKVDVAAASRPVACGTAARWRSIRSCSTIWRDDRPVACYFSDNTTWAVIWEGSRHPRPRESDVTRARHRLFPSGSVPRNLRQSEPVSGDAAATATIATRTGGGISGDGRAR